MKTEESSQKCAGCGSEIGENDKFCTECGRRLIDSRGSSNLEPTENLICKECGKRIYSVDSFNRQKGYCYDCFEKKFFHRKAVITPDDELKRRLSRLGRIYFGFAALYTIIFAIVLFSTISTGSSSSTGYGPPSPIVFILGVLTVILLPAIASAYGRSKKRILESRSEYRYATKYNREIASANEYVGSLGRAVHGIAAAIILLIILGACILSGITAIAIWDTNQALSILFAIPPIGFLLWILKPDKKGFGSIGSSEKGSICSQCGAKVRNLTGGRCERCHQEFVASATVGNPAWRKMNRWYKGP
jgi:DNA-directed RNA polymerase subunit RPC12/RpoP